MTISTGLIIAICIFVAVMYLLCRIFNYLDYEQKYNNRQKTIKELTRKTDSTDNNNIEEQLKNW